MARERGNLARGASLENRLFEVGFRLGEAIAERIRERESTLAVPNSPRKLTREPLRSCTVPGCLRPALAKALCAAHYRKARRLRLADPLAPEQLEALGRDGRKNRSAPADR